jgi:ATP-binding cassette subfamily B protein
LKTSTDPWSTVPAARRREIEDRLEAGETLLGWFQPDLDDRLFYAQGLIVLTDRRVLAADPVAADGDAAPLRWCGWRLEGDASLYSREHAGVGTLELVGPEGRLAHWRYTAARAADASRLLHRFEQHRNPAAAPAGDSICPTCGAVIPPEEGRCPKCAPAVAPRPTASLFRLLEFARPRARVIALGLALTFASTAAGLVPPYLTMPLLDRILIPYQNNQTVDFGLVPWYLGGLVAAAILAWLLDWGRLYVLAWVSERISADLRNRTYAHMQQLSVEFFGGKRTGDLMSRVGSDTDRICNWLSLNLLDFVTDIVMMFMTAGILFTIDPLLALVTMCPFPFIVWLVHRVRNRLRHGFRLAGIAWAAMISVLADTIPGIRVVKAFAQERREVERFGHSNDHVLNANDRVNVVWSFFGPMVTLLTTMGLLVVWGFAIWGIYRHAITVGVLTAFLAYIARFYTKIESMIRMVAATQRAGASAQRIFEILDKVPSVPEPQHPIHPGRLSGRIELREVTFKYGTRQVLHGINLVIEPGEMIGLVGASGAGKSTLINLICRFYDVATGAILVDGKDIRSFPVEEYRLNIGIVLQDPFLFYGTIAENIAYGRPEATRDEVIAAARAARAHEFILRLPDGYDSLVGERGQSLSGGERQRISIARALLIDPRILILDEATSSVDTETEREIQAALETLIRGRTTLAIAHRLSTLRRADRLVVMERGRIAEIGNHQELLKAPGSYARLHRAQQEMAQEQPV